MERRMVLQGRIQLVHVPLVVPPMMDLHGLGIHRYLKGVGAIGKRRKCEGKMLVRQPRDRRNYREEPTPLRLNPSKGPREG